MAARALNTPRVQGLGFRVSGVGLRIWGLGCRFSVFSGLEFRAWSLGRGGSGLKDSAEGFRA